MAVPSEEDIQKKQDKLQSFLKVLDDDGKLPERRLISKLRSAIRQVWMRSENKLAVLEQARVPDMDKATRTKWLFRCNICEEMFKESDVEIDHVRGNHSFTVLDDFENYCDKILNAGSKDLQVLCKGCHSVKTYMEGNDLTWEQAVKEKWVIEKTNQKVDKQKKELLSEGFKPKDITNQEKRKECYRILMRRK